MQQIKSGIVSAWRSARWNGKLAMLAVGFAFICCAPLACVSLLASGSPRAATVPTATRSAAPSPVPSAEIARQTPASPTDTPTPRATNTPAPTATATETPLPTSTPLPPTATPTPRPTNTPVPPTATPTPITLSGQGQQASSKFTLRSGLAVFRLSHSGSRNFAVWLLDASGNKIELLVNTIGSFTGAKAVGIRAGGPFVLDVTADGAWTISAEQPTAPAGIPQGPQTFRGRSQQVAGLFGWPGGLTTFRMTHSGARNFAVWLMDQNGQRVELLVNTIGPFNGSKAVGTKAGVYLLDIAADGDWTITVE